MTLPAQPGVRLGLRLDAEHDSRSNDAPEVSRHRLDVFTAPASSLITRYRHRNILIAVDDDQPPETIATEIPTRLSDLCVQAAVFRRT